MSAAQDRFDRSVSRADELLLALTQREKAEVAREDAAREEARRQRQRDNAEQRRQIAGVYDDAYRSFGTEVPAPVDDEAPSRYRARLFNRLARRLPDSHELAAIRADDLGSQPIVLDNFEAQLLKAAMAEGEKPSYANLPASGELISRTRSDDSGGKQIEWHGRESFIKSLSRPARIVARIIDPVRRTVIFGAPFPRAE